MPPGINLAAVSDALKALSSVGQLVPVVGETIAGALELGSQICELIQDVKDNKDALHQLAISAGLSLVEIAKIIQTAEEPKRAEYQSHITELYKALQDIKETVSSINKKGLWSRTLSRRKVKQTITELDNKLTKACTRFGIYETLRNKITSSALLDTTRSIVNYQQETLSVVKNTQVTAERAAELVLLEKLKPVAADFNSNAVSTSISSCLAETRVRLLEDIQRWADAEPGATSPSIFWLSGLAGTGKSTVARTVCELFTAKYMVVSFFFSRQTTDRRDLSRVACSLAFQIASGDTALRSAICKVIQDNLDIATRSITEQIRLLLAEPLQACAPLSRPVIIVLDALDESDSGNGGEFVPALAAAINLPSVFPSVRLFMTSRNETSIRSVFNKIQGDAPHQLVQLHEIEHSIVRDDIVRYLEYMLREIPKKIPDLLPNDWPEQADLAALAERAGVLFVYAATLVRFIDSELDDPTRQLRSILDDAVADSEAAYGVVDALYLQILDKVVRSQAKASHPHCQRLRDVVGALILLQNPLPADCLARLIGIGAADVTLLLRQLTSVLIVRESGPITIFHPSFPDFMLDSERCTDERFRVNKKSVHTILARRCLAIMNQYLRRDICGIRNPSLLNSEVGDLSERLQRAVPQELLYACQHWFDHVFYSVFNKDPLIGAELHRFVQGKLLYYIEVLSLMGLLHLSYTMIRVARMYTIIHSGSEEDVGLLTDTEHMVRDFYPAIQESALHVYYSAVPLMPKCHLLDISQHEAELGVCLLSERNEGWNEQLSHTVQSGSGSADLLFCLPDGTRVLCTVMSRVSHPCWTMHVWEIATGELLVHRTTYIEVDEFDPVAVAVSPDGSLLARNAPGYEPKILSIKTGQDLLILHYSSPWDECIPTEEVVHTHIAFSSDGRRVVGSGRGSTVHLWDAITGQLEATFGNVFRINRLCFSPNGDQIICNTRGHTIRIWDIQTKQFISEFRDMLEDGSYTLRMSPLTTELGALCKTGWAFGYRVWSLSNGDVLRTIRLDGSHSLKDIQSTPLPRQLAFSSNGQLLCLNAKGETLYLWDLNTGALRGTLEKFSDAVHASLAISDDCSCEI